MELRDFLDEIDDAVATVLDSTFEIEVCDTKTVPRFDDSLMTWDNLDEGKKKCKQLESCVLYIDIRNSAALNVDKRALTLARLYSAFIRSMLKAAKYFGGHVRNIIGDRVMVVFDQEDCFVNAVNTAVLMNSISQYIIDRHYASEFRCGIGIDYGKMLVTKAGELRRGAETEFYRSLVWLGRPANVASRLTDLANKTLSGVEPVVSEGYYYPAIGTWRWADVSYNEFLDRLQKTHSPVLSHPDPYFSTFVKSVRNSSTSQPPILMTAEVLDGFKRECPDDVSVVNGWWSERKVDVKEYSGKTFGADVVFTVAQDLK